jgi:membrane associated rhomboid family serine protease
LRQHADEIPVTLLVALAWVTLLVVCEPFRDEEFAARLARFGWLTPHGALAEPWRLCSYSFLHGGVLHLVFNLSALMSLGPALERSLGSLAFALLYVVSAITGGLAICLANDPFAPTVGGSGSVFGMLGALVAMNMRSGRHVFAFLDFEGPRRLLGWIAVNLLIGFLLPMVSNSGHIGGLLGGFLLTFLWLRSGSPTRALWQWRAAITALAAGLLFAVLVPVTRSDWLAQAADQTGDERRHEALVRAMLRSAPSERLRRVLDDPPATEGR